MAKIKLTIPHNWHSDFLKNIDLSGVREVYGKLDADIVGGGEPADVYPAVSYKTIEQEIRKIHQLGLQFNYLANTLCLDNRELTYSMQAALSKLLDWLTQIKVDSISVSLPYLLGFIKKNYPALKINVSTTAQVDTPDKAKFWEDLGVSKITLSAINVNRDFTLIKKIRNSVKCQLQLIANKGCLYNCPFALSHSLFISHLSQKEHFSKRPAIDFYRIMCIYLRLKDPVNFIRSDWIRPEDLAYYEGLGIDFIKIINTRTSTQILGNIINAYTQRNYNGNLLNLLPERLRKIPQASFLIEDFVYIDNKGLDGFLVGLQGKKCNSSMCTKCNWCREIAARAIKIDSEKITKAIKELEDLKGEMVSGRLFQYR